MSARCAALLLATLPAAGPVAAADVAIAPGVYVTERGWGVLEIARAKNGATTFSLEAMGGNAHSCSLDGEIRNGRAVLEAFEKDKPCTVTFAAAGAGVRVGSVEPSACRYYCGMRAMFEGEYLKPAGGCAPVPLNRARETFKRQYDAKQFAEARAMLEPLLARCARTLDWLQTGWMRNDLAVTQYRLGDRAGCLATLQPLAPDAAKSDAQIAQDMVAPTDVENWLPVVRAARTNFKLCGTNAPR